MKDRIVITGMSVITPIGDNLNDFFNNLINGKSAITKLKTVNTKTIRAKIGGDLGDYDFTKKLNEIKNKIPDNIFEKIKNKIQFSALSNKLTILCCIDSLIDSKYFDANIKDDEISCIIAGHNFNGQYIEENIVKFINNKNIDDNYYFKASDYNINYDILNILQIKGNSYLIGGTCASGGIALKNGINELLHNDQKMIIIGGAVLDYSGLGLQALILADAISYKKFNETPDKASRPFDKTREGFIASHGTGFVVIEKLSDALKRNAAIHAEILGVECNNDANHLPNPSITGQVYVLNKLLKNADIKQNKIDYINAHATSTLLGDMVEVRTIKEVFKDSLDKIKVNAPKSILGHTCWSAHLIELIAGILQMNNSILHPSINIDQIEEEIIFDVCPNQKKSHNIDYFINNSFGFGGINCSTLVKKFNG